MFGFCSVLVLLFVLFACSEKSTTSSDVPEDSAPFGWLDGGFTPVIDFSRGGGLQKIAHSGDWIVLEDAWTGPVDSSDTLFGKSTYTPRLFISKIGSDSWDTIKPPTKENIKTLYADSTGIFVGTYVSGELWKYQISGEWVNLEPYQLKENEGYNIFGISNLDGNLFVSMSGYRDKSTQVYDSIRVLLLFLGASGWVNTAPEDVDSSIKVQFHKGVSLENKFYSATTYGVWSWSTQTSRWKPLPKFPEPLSWSTQVVKDLVAHKGKLYALVSDRVYYFDESVEDWISIDSLRLDGDTTGYNYRLISNVPYPAKCLVSDGTHLFVAGGDGIPYVYMGDYGEPYGNIPKGWRKVGSWCKNFNCLEGGGTTYSMDVIGDTLYVANWKNLLKFPLDKLDSAIANEKDFW